MSTCMTALQYCMDILNAAMYYLGYKAIYVFSVCQIFYEKMSALAKSPRLDYIRNKWGCLNISASCNQAEDRPKYFIECFDKRSNPMNKTVMHYDTTNYAQVKCLIEECNDRLLINDASYIIYNAPTNNGLYDKMIISDNTFANVKWSDNKIIYKCVTYDFMSVQLKFINDPEDVVYNVALKTDVYNFYIEGNVINRDFILYYSHEILNIGEKLQVLMNNGNNAMSYKVTIVDADVNVLNITDEQSIILGEHKYTCV
jgi:hypothetical protein